MTHDFAKFFALILYSQRLISVSDDDDDDDEDDNVGAYFVKLATDSLSAPWVPLLKIKIWQVSKSIFSRCP